MSKQPTYFSGLLLLFFLAACASPGTKPAPPTQKAGTTNVPKETAVAMQMAQTGDIALRTGLGPDSYMLIQMNSRDKKYSHCGIVVVENGCPFVYHSIGGEDNPAIQMRRDSLSVFFSARYNSGFALVRYLQDSVTQQKVAIAAKEYFKRSPRFDMDFDLATDDKLYCSELVYKVERRATADSNYILTSANGGKKYVGIDDLYLNPHARIIWKVAF